MTHELIKRGFIGMGFGGIVIFVALTVIKFQAVEVSIDTLWLSTLASLFIGVYYGVASLIFNVEVWSPLKQTSIHFCLSLIIFFPTAVGIGWIPNRPLDIAIGFLIFLFNYLLFWFCLRWYFKRLTAAMNNSLKS